jgi:DNA invertase Pin-like site-specific DNA recombinase
MTSIIENGVRVIHYAARSRREQGTVFPSTEAQLIRLRQDTFMKRQVVVAEFEEVDHSGRYLRGPKLKEALDLLKNGQADVLKVVRWNRIARNLYRRFQFYEMLQEWGAAVEAIEDKLDFSSAKGRLIANVLGAIDQYHSEEAGELMALKIKQRVVDKQIPAGVAPFGYRMRMIPNPDDPSQMIRSGEMEIDPEEARQLVQLKDWLLQHRSVTFALDLAAGAGFKRLVQSRNREGTNKRLINWTRQALEYVMANETYLGKIRYKDQLYPGRHTPLFTLEEFAELQIVLATCSGNSGKGDRRTAYPYILGSRLWHFEQTDEGPRYDPYHGYQATKTRADGTPYRYYRRLSSTRRHYASGTREKGERLAFSQLKVDDIEAYVLGQLRRFVTDDAAWDAMLQRTDADCQAGLRRVSEMMDLNETDIAAAAHERAQVRKTMLTQYEPTMQAELVAILTDLNQRDQEAQQLKLDCITLRDWYSRAPQEMRAARQKYYDLVDAWDRGQRRVAQGLIKDLLRDQGVVVSEAGITINLRAGLAVEEMSNRCGEIEIKRAWEDSNPRPSDP